MVESTNPDSTPVVDSNKGKDYLGRSEKVSDAYQYGRRS